MIILVIRKAGSAQAADTYLRGVEGSLVHLAFNEEQGLRDIRNFDPDLIVLDDLADNLSFVRKLRQGEDKEALTGVFILVIGPKREEVETLNSLADEFIPRPFDGEELRARAEALLRRSSRK